MKNFLKLSKEESLEEYKLLLQNYEKIKSQNLKLDMSRGKPESRQLDLSLKMLDEINSESEFITQSGVDVRNYGVCDGLPEMKNLFRKLRVRTKIILLSVAIQALV